MKYKLTEESDVGVVVDITPILRDKMDTFNVSFILPEIAADKAVFRAIFRGENNVEYEIAIIDGVARIPKEILGKEQRVELAVCLMDDKKILRAWECTPFDVGSFLRMRKRLVQVKSHISENSICERLSYIEQEFGRLNSKLVELSARISELHEENIRLKAGVNENAIAVEQVLKEQDKRLAVVYANNQKLATAYNKATEVINGLSERIYNLEKNYDPTIIA